jgi:gluconate 2-dehydrogenase gamma chain
MSRESSMRRRESGMKRREFILVPVRIAGGAIAASLAAEAQKVPVSLRFFSAVEAKAIEAAAERVIPADENGPGATDAGVVIYIDRQLAGPYGRDKYRYTKPPFLESLPEHGYQGKETPRDIYHAGIARLGPDFASATAAEQDRRLIAIQTSMFFRMLRQHTVEGMFSDPLHGGNENLAGWQMIGYPGPLMGFRDQIDQARGEAWLRKPVSLTQILGRTVSGWEDEKD